MGAVATRLGLDVIATASGIHRVVNARMADQIRLMTIKRGHDPRQFTLVVLGGAGPVHGAALAEEIGMAEVLVPEAPGVLAAFGLLAASIEHHHARTLHGRVDAVDVAAVNACLADLDATGRARMSEEAVPPGEVRAAYAADMRYVGQAYELEVPIEAPVAPAHLATITEAFHAAHERVYGYARRVQPVEFVNFRATHTYPLPAPRVRSSEGSREAERHQRPRRAARPRRVRGSPRRFSIPERLLADARIGERPAYFAPAGFVATAIFDRARLPVGGRLVGPAIVEQPDTTTVIPPGHAAVVEASGNLRIRRAT